MCWFDESVAWLTGAISSYAAFGITDLVAVDGAFELFPNATPRSQSEQHQVILEVAHAHGLGCIVYTPDRLWLHEMEKRSYSFQLAEQMSTEEDWYCVFDADEMLMDAGDAHKKLRETDKLTVWVTLVERKDPGAPQTTGERDDGHREFVQVKFIRAMRGLRVVGNHYTYQLPDGRNLVGNPGMVEIEPAEVAKLCLVEHRTHFRHWKRRAEQRAYYRARDESAAERDTCARCEKPSVISLPHKYERVSANEVSMLWIEVCEDHVPEIGRENVETFRRNEWDPSQMFWTMRRPLRRVGIVLDEMLKEMGI